MKTKPIVKVLFLLMALLSSACTTTWTQMNQNNNRQGVSSSLVDYLYPDGEIPQKPSDELPTLNVPLRIGLAFVPGSDAAGFNESRKQQLLEKVKLHFKKYPFIDEIQIIPETYLSTRRGFTTVEQVARLYGVDVMALVSYDQVIHTDDTKASLLYWTIIGAYFIKGSQFDTATFVDTAVFDVSTRKLLLRAPGVDDLEATATLINSPEALREARTKSFENAVTNMITNLDKEMSGFKDRLNNQQDKVANVSYRAGYSGGGAMLWCLALLLVPIAARWSLQKEISPVV
jgi:rhombotail lipoprotein